MSQNNAITKRNTPVVTQTGPKTLAGKKASSQNAQKGAIFTKGYLASENIEQKQMEYEALTVQWGAYDPTRQMILRTIEQANLGIERQMLYEKQKIEALMQSADVVQQFARHAGLSAAAATMMPAWYFSDGGVREKRIATFILKVFEQAEQLIQEYSDQIAPHIKTRYPDLYNYLMEEQAVTAQFLIVLGKTYKQTTAILNLHKLIEGLEKHYYHHLVWAKDADRYQILVIGLRAQKIEEAIDLDKSNRYATHLQGRLLKGINALVTMDQIEANSLSMAQAGLTISEAELDGSSVSLAVSSAPDADALEAQK
jgi:hypothetical protein